MTFEIVLLAMVAAFLGMRLYSVLGKRTGHEQEVAPLKQSADERVMTKVRPPLAQLENPTASVALNPDFIDISANSGLRSVANADRQFDPALFLEGAKSAYGMILEAYWKGDIDQAGLRLAGRELRARHWQLQAQAGVELLPVGDFAWYDQMLAHSLAFGAVPSRFAKALGSDGRPTLDTLFAMARGAHTCCNGEKNDTGLNLQTFAQICKLGFGKTGFSADALPNIAGSNARTRGRIYILRNQRRTDARRTLEEKITV